MAAKLIFAKVMHSFEGTGKAEELLENPGN